MKRLAKNLDLTLENLQHLNGGLASAQFKEAVEKVADDLTDRPHDKGVRKIVVTVTSKPLLNGAGNLTGVNTTIDFKTQLPDQRSDIYTMKTKINDKGKAGLTFNPDLPDDPDGTSVMQLAEQNQTNDE